MNHRALSRKAVVVLFSALAIVAASGPVLAGYKLENNVSVSATSASGAVGTARASADSNQYIRCHISGTTTSKTAGCAARDAAGNILTCTANSSADHLAAAAAASGPNSSIVFYVNSSGACTQIIVYNGSQYKPMVP